MQCSQRMNLNEFGDLLKPSVIHSNILTSFSWIHTYQDVFSGKHELSDPPVKLWWDCTKLGSSVVTVLIKAFYEFRPNL